MNRRGTRILVISFLGSICQLHPISSSRPPSIPFTQSRLSLLREGCPRGLSCPLTQTLNLFIPSLVPKTWSLVGWPPLGKQGACRAGGTDSGSHISRRTPLPCRRNETPLSPQKEITCRCSNSRLHQHQKVQTNHKPIRRGKNTQFQKECPAPGERKTTA